MDVLWVGGTLRNVVTLDLHRLSSIRLISSGERVKNRRLIPRNDRGNERMGDSILEETTRHVPPSLLTQRWKWKSWKSPATLRFRHRTAMNVDEPPSVLPQST